MVAFSQTREYKAWTNMKQRCFNSNNASWRDYGGRGITVSEKRWLLPKMGAKNFYEDMGDCPRGWTLERRNNNVHYNAANCIWVPRAEQAINKRKAYNSRSGWLIGTLEELFPPMPDEELPFMVPLANHLTILSEGQDLLGQGGKWMARAA